MVSTKLRDLFRLKCDLVRVQHFTPDIESSWYTLWLSVLRSVLGSTDEIINGFPTNLQGHGFSYYIGNWKIQFRTLVLALFFQINLTFFWFTTLFNLAMACFKNGSPLTLFMKTIISKKHVGTYVLLLCCTDKGKCIYVCAYISIHIHRGTWTSTYMLLKPFLKNEGNALPLEVLPGAHHRHQVSIQAPWRVLAGKHNLNLLG